MVEKKEMNKLFADHPIKFILWVKRCIPKLCISCRTIAIRKPQNSFNSYCDKCKEMIKGEWKE